MYSPRYKQAYCVHENLLLKKQYGVNINTGPYTGATKQKTYVTLKKCVSILYTVECKKYEEKATTNEEK